MSFGWSDLYLGNRFWAPLSEAALLEAGRSARLHGGMTLLEAACGNGAAGLFLAEEFHLYARGHEELAEMVVGARDMARRSPAAHRVRFICGDPAPGLGPVDVVCSLRRPRPSALQLLRGGGILLWGRYVAADDEVARAFPPAPEDPPGEVVWRREATPLEWERFYGPQERALRKYRRRLGRGQQPSSVATQAERQIEAFRSHGSCVSYELLVVRPHAKGASRMLSARSHADPPKPEGPHDLPNGASSLVESPLPRPLLRPLLGAFEHNLLATCRVETWLAAAGRPHLEACAFAPCRDARAALCGFARRALPGQVARKEPLL